MHFIRKATQITLNNVASTIVVNEKLNITGTFKVEGKGAKTTNIAVYDNNTKLATVSSNDNGVFSGEAEYVINTEPYHWGSSDIWSFWKNRECFFQN